MAILWKTKLSELKNALAELPDQGPADVLKGEGERIAAKLASDGEVYDRQSNPIPATTGSVSDVVTELDRVASLVDGNPAAPSTFAAAKVRLTAALSGANELETAVLNRALAVSEPGPDTAAASSGVQKGTKQVYKPKLSGRGTHETVPDYYTRGELEEQLMASLSEASQWLTLVSGL